jgi:SAM-dependent methyltransferase
MREIVRVFDKASPTYDDWYGEGIGARVFTAEFKGLDTLLPAEGLGVEVGSGTGVFAEKLIASRRDVICVDPSPGMLMSAVERGLSAILGVGEALPVRSGTLDFAYMVTVIEFVGDPLGVLKSLRHALKEGAVLVTLTINRGSAWGAYYVEKAEKRDSIFSYATLYEMDEVKALHERADYVYVGAVSALRDPPWADDVGVGLLPPDPNAGVALIKSVKKG